MHYLFLWETNLKVRELLESYFENDPVINFDVYSDVNKAKQALKIRIYDLLIFGTDETPSEISFLKEIRNVGINTPACLYTNTLISLITEQMEGQNCITVIPRSEQPKVLVKKIRDVLDLITFENIKTLHKINNQMSESHCILQNVLLKITS